MCEKKKHSFDRITSGTAPTKMSKSNYEPGHEIVGETLW